MGQWSGKWLGDLGQVTSLLSALILEKYQFQLCHTVSDLGQFTASSIRKLKGFVSQGPPITAFCDSGKGHTPMSTGATW